MEIVSILEIYFLIKWKPFPFGKYVTKSNGNLCLHFGYFLGVSKMDQRRHFQGKNTLCGAICNLSRRFPIVSIFILQSQVITILKFKVTSSIDYRTAVAALLELLHFWRGAPDRSYSSPNCASSNAPKRTAIFGSPFAWRWRLCVPGKQKIRFLHCLDPNSLAMTDGNWGEELDRVGKKSI